MMPTGPTRSSAVAALVAGVLWGAMGVFWAVAPKLQADSPPYAIIDRPLFVLYWLAVTGAVLCSGLAVLGLVARQRRQAGGFGRASAGAAWVTVGTATIAGVVAGLAGLGVAEEPLLGILSLALMAASLGLLASLVALAIATLRTHALPGWRRALPAALAALTLLTLGAIMASGAQAVAALVAAILIVTATGATWLLLAQALWRRHATTA